jgi:hypothetical protein
MLNERRNRCRRHLLNRYARNTGCTICSETGALQLAMELDPLCRVEIDTRLFTQIVFKQLLFYTKHKLLIFFAAYHFVYTIFPLGRVSTSGLTSFQLFSPINKQPLNLFLYQDLGTSSWIFHDLFIHTSSRLYSMETLLTIKDVSLK